VASLGGGLPAVVAVRDIASVSPATEGELTQSCPVRARRPHVAWPMRARCRSTPRHKVDPSCHLAGAYSTAYPCRRRGLRRVRDRCARDSYPTVRVSPAQRLPRLALCRPLDGVKLCAQPGLSLSTEQRSTPRPRPRSRSPLARPPPRPLELQLARLANAWALGLSGIHDGILLGRNGECSFRVLRACQHFVGYRAPASPKLASSHPPSRGTPRSSDADRPSSR
jgi:hypothetical protein